MNNAGLRIFRNGEGKMMNLPLATSPAFHGENPAFQRFPKHPMGTPQMIIWVPVSQPEKFKKTLPVYIIYIYQNKWYMFYGWETGTKILIRFYVYIGISILYISLYYLFYCYIYSGSIYYILIYIPSGKLT